MDDQPRAVQRFIARSHELGIDVRVEIMPGSTRTAEDAATACGCSVAQIVKSLVFQRADTGAPVLLLVSGANRVDTKAVADILGSELKRADADAVRDVTGFAIGGIPPFGHDTPLITLMDEELVALEPIWAAAGTPKAVFATSGAELAKATGATIAALKAA